MPYEPTSNFNIGTKLEFKIFYKWNIFFAVWNCSSSSSTSCNTKARKTAAPPPQKKRKREKAKISTALWRNEKAQSTLNPTN
jgi:hypothetical protein